MCMFSYQGIAVVVFIAFILLVAAVYQWEKNQDTQKTYDRSMAKMQVEIMARARNQLLDKLKLAESERRPVSLMHLVREVDAAMSVVNYLGAVGGDYTRPRLRFMTYQDEICFMFSSKATSVEIDFLYPKSQYILP